MKTYKVTKCTRGGKTEATVEASNLREATEKAFKAVNYRDIRNAVVNDIFIHLNGEKKATYIGSLQKWVVAK